MKTTHLLPALAVGLVLTACERPAEQEPEDTPEPDTATATEPAGTLPREGASPEMQQESETTLQEAVPVEREPERPEREEMPEETQDEPVGEPPPRA